MKKFLILFLSVLLFSPLSAQSSNRQVVVPHTIYVGDTAQLNISFTAKAGLLGEAETKGHNPQKDLSAENFDRVPDLNSYTIKRILLSRNGNTSEEKANYTLTIIFTPWVTGQIKIPPYKIDKDFLVIPSEITVDSIFSVPKTPKTFVENKGPLLIPGTTYRILGKLIIWGLLFITGIVILCRKDKVGLWYKNQKLKHLYSKNKKQTIAALNKLKVSAFDDKEKAEETQKLLRSYLTLRFGYPFSNCGASEIWKGFDEIFQGLLSEEKEEAVENLTGIFIRTDYIRYSKNISFDGDEFSNLVSQIIDIINTLEAQDKKEEDK